MSYRRTALSFLLAVCMAPASAIAQDRTASAVGFGGASLNSFSTSASKVDFGFNVAKELTPNIQVVGEFGRLGNMLPSLASGILAFTPYDVSVSAFYGEGGLRLLAAPDSGVSPYVEATAGIARLSPHLSGFGSTPDAILGAGLGFLRSTEPILGVGGGFMLRGGPVVADVGYRYKQVAGGDSLVSLLGAGQNLRAHQVRFGIGVRF
ncbi:MAG TPA: outer membrane beta-barrel protein [Vicinamibacterales bacterium]|nr:outer membrane beta-barrel protein [Vicinamibacterales bacterium]